MKKVQFLYSNSDVFNAVISSTFGCYTSFTLMANIKRAEKISHSMFFIILSSISLTIFSLWPLQFLALLAMGFSEFELKYKVDMTILSYFLGTSSVIIGFSIAVLPQIYTNHRLYYEKHPNKEITYFEFLRASGKMNFNKKFLFYIFIGGLFSGPGILSLHIFGVHSLVFPGTFDFHWEKQSGILILGLITNYAVYLGFFFAHSPRFKVFSAIVTSGTFAMIHFPSIKLTEFFYDPTLVAEFEQSTINHVVMRQFGKLATVFTYSSANLMRELAYLWLHRNITFMGKIDVLIEKNKEGINYLQRVITYTMKKRFTKRSNQRSLKSSKSDNLKSLNNALQNNFVKEDDKK